MKPTSFVEYYRFVPGNPNNPNQGAYQEVCGSDGIAYLDGRWGAVRKHREAATIGKARGFDGYRLCRGTHTRPFYLTAAVQPILDCNVYHGR